MSPLSYSLVADAAYLLHDAGGSRIPLLISWPEKLQPRAYPLPHLVSHLDLLPTFLNAANVPLAGELPPVQGPPTLLPPTTAGNAGMGSAVNATDMNASAVTASSAAVVSMILPSPEPLLDTLPGRSLASLLAASSRAELTPDRPAWQGGWAHGSSMQRTLFCEVGESRAVFTSRYRLLYAPRIKPVAKGGVTDVRHNYQAHRHHSAYWRPLQLYHLASDPTEQRNLINPAERAALNLSAAGLRELRETLSQLQQQLRAHIGAIEGNGGLAAECSSSHH